MYVKKNHSYVQRGSVEINSVVGLSGYLWKKCPSGNFIISIKLFAVYKEFSGAESPYSFANDHRRGINNNTN